MRLGKLGGGWGWWRLQGVRVPLVNPDDPLRARATLLLGSGCGALSYNRSDFTRFRRSARLRERQTGARSDCFRSVRFSTPPPVSTAPTRWIRLSGASPEMSGGILLLKRHE